MEEHKTFNAVKYHLKNDSEFEYTATIKSSTIQSLSPFIINKLSPSIKLWKHIEDSYLYLCIGDSTYMLPFNNPLNGYPPEQKTLVSGAYIKIILPPQTEFDLTIEGNYETNEEGNNAPLIIKTSPLEEQIFRIYAELKDASVFIKNIRETNAQEFATQHHDTLGRALRNNEGLWEGHTNIAKYLKSIGCKRADDMSEKILMELHDFVSEQLKKEA